MTSEALRAQLREQLKTIRQYRETDQYNHLLAALETLDAIYAREWIEIPTDRFEIRRGAGAQVRLLMESLISETTPVL